jgi:hypothetical protein
MSSAKGVAMTDFEQRLQQAVDRGKKRADLAAAQERAQRLSEEELKRLHSKYRLEISEHIEGCIKRFADYFLGFRVETIYGERGWGAACFRDDVRADAQRRSNVYTRLEVTVRPHNEFNVIDLAAKGTVQNKEVFRRAFHEEISDADPSRFNELVDTWILEFAELYSTKSSQG